MTAVAERRPESLHVAPPSGRLGRLKLTLADTLVLTKRSLTHTVRSPELLIFATIQPVMFVLLFRYVFGGAISVRGTSYVNYLMAGIFVQSVSFGAMTTGVGLATDLTQGLVDRFRSLPMSRSAVLTGRTLGDLGRNMFTVLVMLGVGLLVGFRPHGSPLRWLGAAGLLLLISFSLSWISATIGLLVRNVEAVQSAGFVWLFPLTFASSAFVPTSSRRAARLRRAPADHPGGQRGARARARPPRRLGGLAGGGVVRRDPRRLRAALRAPLPAHLGDVGASPGHRPVAQTVLRREAGVPNRPRPAGSALGGGTRDGLILPSGARSRKLPSSCQVWVDPRPPGSR